MNCRHGPPKTAAAAVQALIADPELLLLGEQLFSEPINDRTKQFLQRVTEAGRL